MYVQWPFLYLLKDIDEKRNELIKLNKIIIKILTICFFPEKSSLNPRINIIFKHNNHWTTSFLLNIISNKEHGTRISNLIPSMKQISRFLLNFFSPATSSCLRRRNPLTGKGRRVDAPRRVRSPQSRRSSKGATNFLPLKTFTQLELNSWKLLQLRKSLSLINVRAWFTCFVSCVCNGTLFRYREQGFCFWQENRKKERKKKDKKKITTKSSQFYTRANETPSSHEFRLHVNPETDDGDSFRRDFSDWFSGSLAVEIILRSPCKTRVSFPPSIFPYVYPTLFPSLLLSDVRWNFIDTPWV